MYNIFKYKHYYPMYHHRFLPKDKVERGFEIRYAVGTYQVPYYESDKGRKYPSIEALPYVTNESTARSRARRRWGYSKMIDVNYW